MPYSVNQSVSPYSVTVFPAVGGHRWVEVVGELDRGAARDLKELVSPAVAHRSTRRVSVDLRRASVRDEAAGRELAAGLADLRAAATAAGRMLATVGPWVSQPPAAQGARETVAARQAAVAAA